jgi:hypothetical protein
MASFGIIGNQMRNWEMKILQNEITGAQTIVFPPIILVSKLSFILSFT